MATSFGKFGIEQVKIEMDFNDFNEASQTDTLKQEPCKISIFNKCGRFDESCSETDFVDHKNSTSYLEQTEEKFYANKPNPEHTNPSEVYEDISTDECKIEQIKNENDIDIFHEDIKREIGDKKFCEPSQFCEACHLSFNTDRSFIDNKNYRLECSCRKQYDSINKDATLDVNQSSLGLSTESGLQRLMLQNKTVSLDECSNKQVSSAERMENNKPDDCLISNHQKSDEPKTKFHCKICSKSFYYTAYNLKIHEKFHTGQIPFNCDICSKSFANYGNLSRHLKIHTGKKTFHCEICSKSFISNSKLNLHLKIHTRGKPFQCKICSKSFLCSINLNRHLKVHTGEVHRCKICSESFNHLEEFIIHDRIHT